MGSARGGSAEAREPGVQVTAILLATTSTPMIEQLSNDKNFSNDDHADWVAERHSIERFGQPGDVGRAAKWLLSDESAFSTAPACPFAAGFGRA